ncbi:MAG: DUF2007 domain-containing protein [Mariniphaga sp.]|nr:DUF2007 domain-containing protein [Mariniphaga sp.]
MEKGWKQVFLTTLEYQAEMAKSILEKNGIRAIIMNQKDSAYQTFGDIAILAEEHLEAKAIELLKELKN